jgi:hypothetical protein
MAAHAMANYASAAMWLEARDGTPLWLQPADESNTP